MATDPTAINRARCEAGSGLDNLSQRHDEQMFVEQRRIPRQIKCRYTAVESVGTTPKLAGPAVESIVTVVMAELDAAAEFVERLNARVNALVSEGLTPRDSARRVVLEFETFKQQASGVHAALADAVFLARMATGDFTDQLSADEVLDRYLPR